MESRDCITGHRLEKYQRSVRRRQMFLTFFLLAVLIGLVVAACHRPGW